MPTSAFDEFTARYANNAALFVEEVLGMDGRDDQHRIDKEQRELLDALSRGERGISIKSGHGCGKTAALAWAIVWHNTCRYPQRVVATAPTGGQLFGALAKETNIWLKKLPPALYDLFDVKSESFNLKADPDDSNTEYRTSRAETPEALAGVHAEAGWVLLIADEASGVPDEVFESASGSMSAHNACTILAGNPVRLTGLFHDTHTRLKDYWHTINMSCIGHPRVSPQYVEDMRRRYGENSNQFRVRVLGEFPLADNDAVIPRDLMELARVREVKPLRVLPIWGLDVGGGGKESDASALVKRIGNVIPEHPLAWHNLEPMQLVGRVKQEWDQTPQDQRPVTICVDSIGMGASVATRLQELNIPARGINVAESPSMKDQYANLKAELWWMAREWFQARDCSIPAAPDTGKEPDLGDELCAVNFEPPTSNGKIRIEPKAHTRKRLGHSPDCADAFILTFAESAVSALHGSAGSGSWKEPLQRDIKWLV